MASLNMLATVDAETFGRGEDAFLIENIKILYKQLAPKYIRQSIERNGIDDVMRKGYVAKIIPIDSTVDTCHFGCPTYRTELTIPTPLRYKSDVPFLFVGTNNSLKPIPYIYILPVEMKYISTYKLNNKIPRYYYLNNYLYFVNIGLIREVQIINIFENPEEVISYCNNNCYNDDMEYPIPADIIPFIRKEIHELYNGKKFEQLEVENNVR